jgi:PAS domain S-box-containing protein
MTALHTISRSITSTFAVIRNKAGVSLRGHHRSNVSDLRLALLGIFENSVTGIAITDLQARVQSCNPAFSAILGYTEEQLRGRRLSDFVHPEDREVNILAIRGLISREIPSFEIVNRCITRDGKPAWVHEHVSLLRNLAGRPAHIVALVNDITQQKQYEEQIGLLLQEVNHRAKNMLAVALAVARQTAAVKPQDFIGRFGERVQALAASQDLLVKNEWKGVEFEELVLTQLANFRELIGTRIALKGPPLFITAPATQNLGMALHELAANAAKYGALSNRYGRLHVEWRLECGRGGGKNFVLGWREQGGPPVAPPAQRGFGSVFLSHVIMDSFDGEADLEFSEAGVRWCLRCPAKEIIDQAALFSMAEAGGMRRSAFRLAHNPNLKSLAVL